MQVMKTEVSEPEVLELEVFLDQVDFVLPQGPLTGLVSVGPWIGKTVENQVRTSVQRR